MSIDAVATLKIAGTQPRIGRAIERFLGQPRSSVEHVAKETLEGSGRSVVAELTAEEVRRDRERFAHAWIAAAEPDFDNLGLCLDTLKIRDVSGGRG
jgi:flotillin